jgi:hypothetical protein
MTLVKGDLVGIAHARALSPAARLFFTDEELIELRAMMAGCRLADPVKFAHIRQELGIDPASSPTGIAGQSRRL